VDVKKVVTRDTPPPKTVGTAGSQSKPPAEAKH
jgi:hypothetical protein